MLACAFAAAGALAEEGPYRVGAGVRLGHDDNVFRAPAGRELATRHTTWRAFAGLDETISRQRLQGYAELLRSDYAGAPQLDHGGHAWRASWDGATVGAWSWRVFADGRRALASYDGVVDDAHRVRNVETVRRLGAAVQRGMQARWIARLGVGHRRVDHSAAAWAGDELRADTLEAGAVHRPLGPLTTSLGVRLGRGRFPQALAAADGFVADRYDRRDLDFGLEWVPTGASELSLRLSATREDRKLIEERSFRGITGRFSWQWQPTGKTRLTATLLRDTGSEAAFLAVPGEGAPATGGSTTSRTTASAGLRVDWQATAKIALGASAFTARRRFGGGGQDDSNVAALVVRYAPTRLSAISCEVSRLGRSGTFPSAAYRATTHTCAAQIAFD